MIKLIPEDEWYAITGTEPDEGRCELCDGTGEIVGNDCDDDCKIECTRCDYYTDCPECDGADFVSAYEERVTYDKEAYERYKQGIMAYSPHIFGG